MVQHAREFAPSRTLSQCFQTVSRAIPWKWRMIIKPSNNVGLIVAADSQIRDIIRGCISRTAAVAPPFNVQRIVAARTSQ
jgi:hypothetical protein